MVTAAPIWMSVIQQQMKMVGTYDVAFEPMIRTLADILEKRDTAFDEFQATGGNACVEYTSDRGSVNVKKNPRLQIWMDLNTQALAYWRDLGLTPSGLKKLNEAALKSDGKNSALEEALKSLGGA